MLCERKEKKLKNKRKENKSSNMMHFRKMRASNINHKDFIVIQNFYNLFLRISLGGCFRIFVIAVCQVHCKNPVM